MAAERLSCSLCQVVLKKMRTFLPITLLLAATLTGCASGRDTQPNKHIPQSGALKVHPGLLDPALITAPKPPPAAPAESDATPPAAEATEKPES
jgi:peptidoglycan-associated lipoprotein